MKLTANKISKLTTVDLRKLVREINSFYLSIKELSQNREIPERQRVWLEISCKQFEGFWV